MRGLYAIMDVQALERRGLAPMRFADAVLSARPAALQLRDKENGARVMLELLRELAPRAVRAEVPVFANDRPDLALLGDCAGVHLGQTDVPPSAARTLAHMMRRELAIGMSVHDDEELERTLAEPIDYVAIGAVFSTAGKQRAAPVLGVSNFERLVAQARRRTEKPIVAIGGITLDNAARIARHADALATIGALLPPDDAPDPYAWVSARAAALHEAALEARAC